MKQLSFLILTIFIVHASTISNWESHRIKFIDGDKQTFIETLPYSSYWNPPQLTQEEILVQNWEFTISQIYLLALTYFFPVGLFYKFINDTVSDRLTMMLSYVGFSIFCGAILVIALYIAIGGWGLPGVIPVGTISILIGLTVGFYKSAKKLENLKL